MSVLTPTYNRCELLVEALESVLGQTFTDFEYIVGSDGGTDPTPEVMRRVMHEDERVRFVRFPHLGQFRTVNALLTMARGEYVAILSDDDFWEPEFLERTVQGMRGSAFRPVLAYTDWSFVFPDGTRRPVSERCDVSFERLQRGCYINTSAVLMDRMHLDMLQRTDGHVYDERFRVVGDWDLWLRLARRGPFQHVCGSLSNYRVHGAQVSGRPTLPWILEQAHIRQAYGAPMRSQELATLFRYWVGGKTGLRVDRLLGRAIDRRPLK